MDQVEKDRQQAINKGVHREQIVLLVFVVVAILSGVLALWAKASHPFIAWGLLLCAVAASVAAYKAAGSKGGKSNG